MQRVIGIERSPELCAESGWYAHIFTLSDPVDEALVKKLEPFGRTMLLRQLARPFFAVRTERFIIRGIFGDSFIRVGVPERGAPEIDTLREHINAE